MPATTDTRRSGFGRWWERRRRRAVAWYGATFRVAGVGDPIVGLMCDCEGHYAGERGQRQAEAGLARLLDSLGELRQTITFNVVAELCRTHPRRIERIREAGHEIACHGWRHERPRELSLAALDGMLTNARACFDAVGIRPIGFRSPESAWSVPLVRRLAAAGFRWNAERDRAPRPYWICPRVLRLSVHSDDWDLAEGTSDADGLFSKWRDLVGQAVHRRRALCLGLHEWLFGESTSALAGLIRFIRETREELGMAYHRLDRLASWADASMSPVGQARSKDDLGSLPL